MNFAKWHVEVRFSQKRIVIQMHANRLSLSPGDGWVAKRLLDVLRELAEEVACGRYQYLLCP